MEVIVVKNSPIVDELLQTNLYRSIGTEQDKIIMEDLSGARAICTIDGHRKLEYIEDYLFKSCKAFLENLKLRLNVYWIEPNDLLEYNQHFLRMTIPFSEFNDKVLDICNGLDIKALGLVQAEFLWSRMNSGAKAKILPEGYIRNYIRSHKGEMLKAIDVSSMVKDAIQDLLKFGIPIQTRTEQV